MAFGTRVRKITRRKLGALETGKAIASDPNLSPEAKKRLIRQVVRNIKRPSGKPPSLISSPQKVRNLVKPEILRQKAVNARTMAENRNIIPEPKIGIPPRRRSVNTAPAYSLGTAPPVVTGIIQPDITAMNKTAETIPELLPTPGIISQDELPVSQANVRQPGGGFAFLGGNEILIGLGLLLLLVIVTSIAK